MRFVSNLVALLIVVSLVIGASVFVSWVVTGVLGLFRGDTVLTVTGGVAYVDPSDVYTVICEVTVAIVGSDLVRIRSVTTIYNGEEYSTTCLNCLTVITAEYPNSANDLVTIKFYFKSNTYPIEGSKVHVIIAYEVGGKVKYASGTITLTD